MSLSRCICRARIRPPQLAGAPSRRTLTQVRSIPERFDTITVDRFRQEATKSLQAPISLWYPRTHQSQSPARPEEYCFTCPDRLDHADPVIFTGRLSAYGHLILRYELVISQPHHGEAISSFFAWLQSGAQHDPVDRLLYECLLPLKDGLTTPHDAPKFHQFDAPLALLYRAAHFNKTSSLPVRSLYIAQVPITDLPGPLQSELPTPRLVREAGKGDVYGSSIWMGLQPTNTPLHRDPNPNLFVQIRGEKVVRMMPPKKGDALFREVQAAVGARGSSRIRGAEMMAGPESELLHEKVWGDDADVQEARVQPGGAVYVPLGWWHSVRSVGEDGDLNASANWWFR